MTSEPLGHALVRAPLAPISSLPEFPSPQISQAVLGARLEVLSRAGQWFRVRGDDGYAGWVHGGYLLPVDPTAEAAWAAAVGAVPVVSLGAVLLGEDGQVIMQLPWGARLLRRSRACHTPDGRSGSPAGGELVESAGLPARFPPAGESVVRAAQLWLGAPYQWGGVTPHGADCSGMVQAIMRLHGIRLPRDSGEQARQGTEVAAGQGFAALRAGDLLFFAETGDRITHVAIGTGAGRIIHAALANGGVACNDLNGKLPYERVLRGRFVLARRLLPGAGATAAA